MLNWSSGPLVLRFGPGCQRMFTRWTWAFDCKPCSCSWQMLANRRLCAFDSVCLRPLGRSNLISPSRMRNGILLDYILYTQSLGASGRNLNIALNAYSCAQCPIYPKIFHPPSHPPAPRGPLGPSCHLLPWLANANLGICNFLCLFIYASACVWSADCAAQM